MIGCPACHQEAHASARQKTGPRLRAALLDVFAEAMVVFDEDVEPEHPLVDALLELAIYIAQEDS